MATTHLPERDFDHLNGVNIKSFNITGNAVNGIHGAVDDYHHFLRQSQFDIMMNYAAQQWTVDLTLPLLDELPYRKVLIPCGFSGLYWPQYQDYFAQMPGILNRYDHLIFHANRYRDIDFAKHHGIDHFSVIPNGAGEAEFSGSDPTFRERCGIPEEHTLILCVGSHTGTKGHQRTIEAFFHAPIKSATLLIVGNQSAQGGCSRRCHVWKTVANTIMPSDKRVLLLDLPRADVVAAFQHTDLFLFLSNIEYSPLVIFEAMAARTPFISLACGNVEGLSSQSVPVSL